MISSQQRAVRRLSVLAAASLALAARRLSVVAAASLALAACGAPQATPVPPTPIPPTATPIPPTATPVPPTATPIPPTATPVPPTPVPAPPTAAPAASLSAAMKKMETAVSYRVELSMTANNLPGLGADLGPGPLIEAKGEVDGKNNRLEMKGLIAVFLSGSPTETVELLTVDGKTYMKGPLPLLGATEAKWYADDGMSSSNPVEGLFKSGQADFKDADFSRTGTVTLDGKRCDVFTGNKDALARIFNQSGLGTFTNDAEANQSEITAGALRVAVCDDGFVHSLNMDIQMKLDELPNQSVDFSLGLRLSDFGMSFKLEAPKDLGTLSAPSLPGLFDATATPAARPTARPTPRP